MELKKIKIIDFVVKKQIRLQKLNVSVNASLLLF